MGVGQQITDITSTDSSAWALATSFVPLFTNSVHEPLLKAVTASCTQLQIPVSEERLTDAALKSLDKCIAVTKYVQRFFITKRLKSNSRIQEIYALVTTCSCSCASRQQCSSSAKNVSIGLIPIIHLLI
jgi:hypothetical protein